MRTKVLNLSHNKTTERTLQTMTTYEKFEYLKEALTTDILLQELYNYYGEWQIESALDSIATDYDMFELVD